MLDDRTLEEQRRQAELEKVRKAREEELKRRLQMTSERQRLNLARDQAEQLGEGAETSRLRESRSANSTLSTPDHQNSTSRLESSGDPALGVTDPISSSDPMNDLLKRDLAERPKSSIEEIFRGRFPTTVSRELEQFGYDLFNNKPSSFTPLENVPVSDDYVVGPGDVFTINVWGSTNFSYTVTVKRDGTIFIPKIGSIKVWGQSFKEMSRTVRSRLSTFFSGIKVEIALETIRMIDVFVIGEVLQPGSYSIPSTASPINALFYAGGPTKRGSLRSLKVIRDNKEVATIDLYDFLIGGTQVKQKLQSHDVIMVPVIGKVAALSGNVRRPAIYEIKNETVYDLLKIAGGLSFTGSVGRLNFERVKREREIFSNYQKLLQDRVQFIPEPQTFHSTRWLNVILLKTK